jgi:hypothetical protein
MSRRKRFVVLGAALVALAGAVGALLASGYLTPRQRPVPELGGEEQDKTGFAADRGGKAGDVKPVPFDGKRAMGYLQAICDIGPRLSGTAGMRKQQELIRKHFEALGARVEAQTFEAKQVSRQNAVEMTNLIVRWDPDKKRRVILCCHYDTRPIADQEPDPRKWREPFLSANDGGSGVALLMELGHHMKDLKLNVGVDFVFFDGEEFIWKPRVDEYFFGSKHFARTWKNDKQRPDYAAAILFDMVGGTDAKFPIEANSLMRARKLAIEVWKVAMELKSPMFLPKEGEAVLDDHIALLDAGIPAIDIIDFSYPHWHRLTDTPANCSAASLAEVSRVVTTWLQRVK